MPLWSPGREWEGEDAYVIGGGDSLRHFDWELLRGRRTIGCNSAFSLGASLCQITVFGDVPWFVHAVDNGFDRGGETFRLEAYGGRVVGCASSPAKLERLGLPWLLIMERSSTRGWKRNHLVWAGNTGMAAANLALILGARRVFLLGFDMEADPARPNWHDLRHEPQKGSPYDRFLNEARKHKLTHVAETFPGQQVINLNENDRLDGIFPRQLPAEHFRMEPAA